MNPLRAWILVSALLLGSSFVVHFSTFAGIDPMSAIPGVMIIHVLIFPPFIAVILYSKKTEKQGCDQKKLFALAPRWMQRMVMVLGAYALINFTIFILLMRGGSPGQRAGKYYLMNHGEIIRESTEAEFHHRQAYIVRGFSGHWLLFSGAAWTLLTGVAAFREKQDRSITGRQ